MAGLFKQASPPFLSSPPYNKPTTSQPSVTMPSTYIVTESSPVTTTVIRSGRGGAGNMYRATPSSSSSSAPSRTAILTASALAGSARRFYSGIGGAGNAHAANERPPLALDDDFRRAAAREHTSVCHTGIGGAGNVYRRKASDASSASSEGWNDAASAVTTKSQMMEFARR
ncbi:hypothetical protein S40288_01297 [Stachybotrys chartarum IBT 40288]|nr:hypothetical protein S40288_01297 [Stachybotrys chartarum IBT 40288]